MQGQSEAGAAAGGSPLLAAVLIKWCLLGTRFTCACCCPACRSCHRLYPFVSCDSEADQVCLLGSYSLLLNRMPRQLADMEWDTMHHGSDLELSSNCLTANKTSSSAPSTVRGTILYTGTGALGTAWERDGLLKGRTWFTMAGGLFGLSL